MTPQVERCLNFAVIPFNSSHSSVSSLSSTRSQEVEERDEQRGSNDGPDNRKRLAAELNGQKLSESQEVSEPRPQNCSDKAQRNRHQTATVGIADETLREASADSRNQQQQQETFE